MKFYHALMLAIILPAIISLNLIADKDNPIQVNPLFNTNLGSQLIIKFSFPSSFQELLDPSKNGSSELKYKQFIGVAFPASVEINSEFTCGLSDGVYNYIVTATLPEVSPINKSLQVEKNVVYCRLDESSSKVPLKIGTEISYTLTITFKTLKIASTNIVKNISLFSATSNNPDKIIIDSIPVLGSLSSYGDYTKYTPVGLEIESGFIIITQGTNIGGTLLYPYNKFDVYLNLKANSFITSADHIVVIRYPTDTITFGNEVKSNAISAYTIESAISGSLQVIKFNNDSYLLSGIAEDLIPNRRFQLAIKNFNSLDNNIDLDKPIEIYVYYKNTYSIFSYSFKNIFKLNKLTTTFSANHPEYWDIYRSGAWPFTFNFQVNSELQNGGYVVIQQANTLNLSSTGGNKISFVASTCDFSNNDITLLDNAFGNRPSCFPLRLDFNYPDASTSLPFKGSGVFFKLSKIKPNKNYSLTVWGFADACSGSSDSSYNPVNGKAYVVPNFQITVYKYLNPLQMNENRFSILEVGRNQQIFAQQTADFAGNCWNAKIQSPDALSDTAYSAADQLKVTIDIGNGAGNTGAVVWYREFFDWQIISQMSPDASCPNCWGKDISSNWPPNESFLYSGNNALGNGSYFMVRINIKNAGAIKMWLQYPHTITTTDGNKWLPGHLVFQFPSAWFIGGDAYKNTPSCYASWGAWDGAVNNQKTLLYTPTTNVIAQTATGDSNFFAGNSQNGNQINSLSLLPPDNIYSGASNMLRLISSFNPGDTDGTGYKWKYMKDFTSNLHASNNLIIGYFTSCVKWKTNLPPIRSLFTYIDIQIKWSFKRSVALSGYGTVISNVRLIKLFPEGGVFNDFSKNSGTIGSTNPFISHVAYSGTASSVCLIEISGSHIQDVSDRTSNTFVLWIMFGTLLETDYNDTSATYPTSSLVNGVSAYGSQSAPSMSGDNLYISNVSANYLNLTYIFKLFNATKGITPDNTPLYNGSYRTPYLFYMGSVIYFTGVKSNSLLSETNPVKPLLVPYYCPNYWFTNDVDKTAAFMPTVIGAWMTMNSFIEIGRVNSYLTYRDSDNNNNPYYNILANKHSSTGFLTSPQKGIGNLANFVSANSSLYATLKFNPYSSSADNILYVFNGTVQNGASASDVTCTGHSLFLSSSITVDANIASYTSGVVSGSISVYSSGKFFYIFGRPFNKAVLYGLGSASGISNNMTQLTPVGFSATSSVYFTGVNRPTLDLLMNNGTFSVLDKIAFFCASCGKSDYNFLSNYSTNSSKTVVNFILDWNSSKESWPGPSASLDKLDIFKSDNAGNIKLLISPPKKILAGSQIEIKSYSNFSSNTICGIIISSENSKIVTECTGTNTITCSIKTEGSSFTACCYNLTVGDTVAISSLTVLHPVDTTAISSSLTTLVYSAEANIGGSTNPFSYSATSLGEISTKYALISSITYSQVNQENGIGKALFQIDLPREPSRDMKLSVNGDFSDMKIQGITPRCVVSFSKDGVNLDENDLLFDSCSTNLSSSIVITTKKMVYKCGVIFNKTIYISLWPVNIIKWGSDKIFTITLQLNNSDSGIANNKGTFDLKAVTSIDIDKAPIVTKQWDTLCAVSSITPPCPGEFADYQFDFDLDTSKNSIYNSTPNEVTIFWPYEYYGSHLSNINCYFRNVLVACLFTDQGILNIKFDSVLPIGNGKSVIKITGIYNPLIENDISFVCTVNSTDFVANKRINILTGSGKLANGINDKNVTKYGNLKFLSVTTPVSDKNPRNTSTHVFRISFDISINSPLNTSAGALPLTIDNTPVLHIYFPNEYKFYLYNDLKNTLTASIDEYTSDSNSAISKSKSLNFTVINISGNRISLTFTDASYTFSSNFRYWDINLNNVINPSNAHILGTKRFYIMLSNSNYSIILKTFTNLNTYASTLLTTPVNDYLKWNRGNSFNYDDLKLVIDVYAKSNPNSLNNITIKVGRYTTAYFNVRANNSNSITPAVTEVKISEGLFKTSKQSYNLVSSYNKPIEFLIGCSCSTLQGYYVVQFSSSDTTNFADLAKLLITVDTSTKAVLSFATPSNIPIGGTSWIKIFLSEPNFDQLKVSWTQVTDSTSGYSSAKMNDTIIPSVTKPTELDNNMTPVYSVFSIPNTSTLKNSVKFTTLDPNACFTWNALNTISLTLDGQTAIIPSSINLLSSFKYYNSETDSILTNKNSIKFSFTPPAAPIYIYCALMCYNYNFLSDADIMNPTIPSSNYLQYYRNLITSTANPVDIVFKELIRGLKYKLKCIVQSTDSDVTNRTFSSILIEKNPNVNNTLNGDIVASSPQSTQCVRFNFYYDPGQYVKNAFINYCQKLFAVQGHFENGCIICTDSELNYIASGLEINNNTSCKNLNVDEVGNSTITNSTITNSTVISNSTITNSTVITNSTSTVNSTRILQSTSLPPAYVNITYYPSYLSLCPIPNPYCTSDVLSIKPYYDYLLQIMSDLNTKDNVQSKLNIANVFLDPYLPATLISDSTVPDLKKVNVEVQVPTAGNLIMTYKIYSGNPLSCYYKLDVNNTFTESSPPTYESIQNCTDVIYCGKLKINELKQTIVTSIPKSNLKEDITYKAYFACVNDIPFSRTKSDVASLVTFNITSVNSSALNNSSINPNSTANNTSSSSAPGIKYSIFLFSVLLFLI